MNEHEPEMEKYDVVFDVKMPGATRSTQYTIKVEARSRIEAHAAAEEQWNAITGQYGVRVTKSVETKEG